MALVKSVGGVSGSGAHLARLNSVSYYTTWLQQYIYTCHTKCFLTAYCYTSLTINFHQQYQSTEIKISKTELIITVSLETGCSKALILSYMILISFSSNSVTLLLLFEPVNRFVHVSNMQ